MSDYISREMALHAIMAAYGDAAEAEDNVRAIPAADVKRVRHGRWKPHVDHNLDDYWSCSECGMWFNFEAGDPTSNESYYCPYCGAKMDGGGSDG